MINDSLYGLTLSLISAAQSQRNEGKGEDSHSPDQVVLAVSQSEEEQKSCCFLVEPVVVFPAVYCIVFQESQTAQALTCIKLALPLRCLWWYSKKLSNYCRISARTKAWGSYPNYSWSLRMFVRIASYSLLKQSIARVSPGWAILL